VTEEAQDAQETSSRSFGWSWIIWPGLLLLLYVLSTGPVVMMVNKKIIRSKTLLGIVAVVYSPMEWAYDNPALHKPLGVYLHLWVPQKFDTKGNTK
jgi:hypothetical protein